MTYGDDGKRKKRIAIIGVSSFLLVAMVVAVTVNVGGLGKGDGNDISQKSTKEISSSMKAIKAICQPTDYKRTCEETLQKAAGNETDPKKLIRIAFKVAQRYINDAAKKSTTLQELEKDPRTRKALNACKELTNMSIAELQHSFEKVGDFDFTKLDKLMADLKIWLSASITYQETCLDGFQNTTTDAGKKMKVALKTAMELSSNGLGIITSLSTALTSLNIPGISRRLLSDNDLHVVKPDDGIPTWVDAGTRRLLAAPVPVLKPNLTVAKDGSGNFTTIAEAVDSINSSKIRHNQTFVLYIKEGVYEEYVTFNSSLHNLVVIGDGKDKTRITGSLNFFDGIPTYHTATVVVSGDNFFAKNIGIENTAGPEKHQAVALRVSGDYAVFYNCSFDGYQDTLYAHTKRQFYRDCTISGTVDFVFGDAAVVLQNCTFLIRKPMINQQNIVTAQGRKERRQPSAIVIQNSTFTAHPDLYPERHLFRSYLGRPWKQFSRTIIMESYIDDLIHPDGWSPWEGPFGLKTCWYTEFNNYGPGANKKARVTWNGIKTVNRTHAIDFTPGRFLHGDDWIKRTGVPYTPYLTIKA